MKSSVWFKQFDFFDKKSIDLNRDLNEWFKSHWFKSSNPDCKRQTSKAESQNSKVALMPLGFITPKENEMESSNFVHS